MDKDPFYTSLCSSVTLQSKKQGFFKDYVSHVMDSVTPETLKAFGTLRTDEERIKFCLRLPGVHDLEPQPFYQTKSAEFARKKREEGNVAMQHGRAKQALLLYCQSVVRSPQEGEDMSVDDGKSLSYALANRSAALYKLQEYDQCLQDVQLALKEGYPDDLRYKLYERMGQCYKQLGQQAKAKVAFQIALKTLEQSSLSEKKKDECLLNMQNEISRCSVSMTVADQNKATALGSSEHVLPSVTGGPSQLFQTASRAVDVKYTKETGRCAITKEPIKTGDTLVAEPPYAACLLPEKFGTHCHECFKRLKAPVGCPNCSGVVFCSVKCRDKALNTYHRLECQFMNLFIGSGMSILCHVAVRMLTQSGLKFFLQLRPTLLKQENEVWLDERKGSYDPSSYQAVYNLVTLEEKRTHQDFMDRTLMATFLLKCLQKMNFFPKISDSKDDLSDVELYIGGLLLRHLQLLQFNAHEIHELKMTSPKDFEGSKTEYLGVAIYPTVSFFNHDCYPAVTRYFVGTSIVIRALRPLNVGEVIAENYGPIFTHKTKKERQKSLQSRYWFECNCQACQEDWPMYKHLTNDTLRLKCTNCGKLVCYSSKKSTTSLKCIGCKQQTNLLASLEAVKSSENEFTTGLKFMDEGKVPEAIDLFSEYLDTMHKHAHPPYRDIHLCQDALRLCLTAEGNVYIEEKST